MTLAALDPTPLDPLTRLRCEFKQASDRLMGQAAAATIAFRTQAGDWKGVAEAKRRQLDLTHDRDEALALHRDLGQLYAEKLGEPARAVEAYQQALALQPDDPSLLHTLRELYVATERWEDAVRTLDQLAALEPDPARRGRHRCEAAEILRDRLHAPLDALERLEAALDDDPAPLDVLRTIEALAAAEGAWEQLERSYRRMLGRLGASGDPRALPLWSALAELYRTRLHDLESAAVALDVVTRLDPGSAPRHVELAALYEQLMVDRPHAHVDAAVRQHHALIAQEPFRYPSYHALHEIYRRAGRVDAAWCVAAVLCFLRQATPEQQAYAARYRPAELPMARRRLSDETLRRHVLHPDQDLYLTGILGVIAPAVAAWRAVSLPASLGAKDRIDVATDPSLFSRMTKYVEDVLDVTQPDAYLRPHDVGDLVLMNIKRDNQLHPTIVVFQNLLRGKAEPHLAFALGRYMMDLYLPHFCFVALDRSPQALKQVLLSCLHGVGLPVQGDVAAHDVISREIFTRMQPAARDQLRSLVQKFIDAGGIADVKRWAAASELTAYRAGLLLCADLHVAGQMISQEQAPLGVGSTLSPRDKIEDLVLYGISEDYFAARRSLGIDVHG